MIKSESIINISKALLVAQKNMSNPVKKSVNPFFKSKYSDLNSILEVCVDPLNEADIILLQPTITKENGKNFVQTLLIHVSGEFIGSECEIKVQKLNDAQAEGSGISYARRYGLQSLLSLSAVDDDGQKAVQEKEVKKVNESLKDKVAKEVLEEEKAKKWDSFFEKMIVDIQVKQFTSIQDYIIFIEKTYLLTSPKLRENERFKKIFEHYMPKAVVPENKAKQSVTKFDKCNTCSNETEFCICDIDKKAPVLVKV